ncbi:VWFA and cache domain-containing protein 1-like isoform X2 [Crassostrea angulata]|uniref:VWFA and cache domain-containing protein 1-like isoform X2 n=1 Tax=Magallana angulata TaxID=2784310 RepID=UPI0022B12669|nr:VWFA and cache domain-containing protein 1-like isoform X2 [Crassostrea angulata]
MIRYSVLIAFFLPCLNMAQDMNQLRGEKFSHELQRMDLYGIGAPDLQAYYDKLTYYNTTDKGADIVKKMANNLQQMFETMTNQLKKVKGAIEQHFNDFSTTPQNSFSQCCKINGTYNPKFRTEVLETNACISRSFTSNRFPNKKIEDVMKENYQNNPTLLWQYFGGSDGTFLIFPSHRFSDNCVSYDPRSKQYYVATAANKPKDVVVAVDVSGVMGMRSNHESMTLFTVARMAVDDVINTLNPNDRIGLVVFNNTASKPPKCHRSQLAKATTTNKEMLRQFAASWTFGGQSNYSEGIKEAFSYFDINETKSQGSSRESIILFLAASNSDADPLDVIKTENEARNNSVIILTYSFGKDINSYWKEVLTNMSKQVKNDNSYGQIKEGTYTHVEEDSLVHSKMASFYEDLSIANLGDEPVFSVPYVDKRSNNTGLITSLCLPVDISGELVGVTCTDILLDELLSDITNFKQGELSYAFMIDGQGRVMVHYLQPTPNAITINPDPIDIYKLETSQEAKSMIESMKRGETGNKTFEYFRTISRGVLEYEGIEVRVVEAEYSWRKVPGTNFSLCVVLGKNDQQRRLRQNQELLLINGNEVFFYHRLDLNSKRTQKCREYDRYSTKEHSMVMLTSHAFETPYEYLYQKETQTDVTMYTEYLNNVVEYQTNRYLKLKANVKSSIQATFEAEQIWKRNQEQSKFVVWRYLGTRDGHVRVYPAVEIAKNYDHFTRPWWRRTLAQKGKFVVISPYKDNWGAGLIVTQCKAVYEGRRSGLHSEADIVDVVMCVDYPYPYFSRMFLNTNPECNSNEYRCMVIDRSGFLVIYPSFSDATDERDIKMKHLGSKEKNTMVKLLQDKIIERESCFDIETKKQFFSYRVSNVSPLENKCRDEESDCCLCYKVVPYDSCQEKTTSGQSYHICSARLPDENTEFANDTDKIKTLSPCFDAGCDYRKDEENCYKVAGCSWCKKDEFGVDFSPDKQCCNIFETCPFGKVQKSKKSRCSSVKRETPSPSSTSNETLIGAASGAGLAVILVVIIIIVICRNRNKANSENTGYLTAVNDNAGYARAGEINYLHEETENAHHLNQYAGMGNSGDGSISIRSAQKSSQRKQM